MKPLTARQKAWLLDRFAFGKGRRLAKPFYEGLIHTLMLGHQLDDRLHDKDVSDVSDLTAVIKTFRRPYALTRLVASIQRLYPDLTVLIADDSATPTHLPGTTTIELPFDSGISVGRNRALEKVKTPYFLLLDDDFLFSRRQQLGRWLSFLRRHPEVDILGGRYIDLPLYTRHRFEEQAIHPTDAAPQLPIGTMIEDCVVVDKVQNYFMGRTETVRKVGWRPDLKVFEHTEFFTRARGQLVTVFHPDMAILHVKYPFDTGYMVYRWRTPSDATFRDTRRE